MLLVGLTGGIGSGKSTVADRLAELGVPVINADHVAREVVEPGEPALADIVARFGDDVVLDDGTLDRQRVAGIVFADPEARRDLDRITHPRIAARIAERIAELLSSQDPPPIVVVDHPLLVETDQAARFDVVVVVEAPEDLRIARLVEGRGMDEDDVRSRIAVQADDEARRSVATHVLDNGGEVDDLLAQIDRLHADLVQAAHQRSA
jgi:dephospho-CoA kinase